ncbi:hypothetical protein [Dysgonomonas macrotermitis]|uniref:C1q domain-containing protein n=1 Tax=Dysgonomonas macrotermitis TaxID=1346286 RepID=A0A1M5HKY7_9BACT|nr:hypothetical protein [Dysgonomonas macrotermitis]SHG16502.1 hypothetical protein SAMN05444362_11695 [Dysgonomonas macrotermitis]
MKKKTLLLLGIFSFGIIHAQIGVNTDNPITGSVLNIDPLGNNSTSSLAKYDDDIVVNGIGNVGIGTGSPNAKLHIVSNSSPAFRLVDGNQADKKILMSDATGTAQWGEAVFNNFGIIPFGTVTFTGASINSTVADAFYSGLSYTLPGAGVYSVSIVVKCVANRANYGGFNWSQVLPTSIDIPTVWGASSPRFLGGYEIYRSGSTYIRTATTTIAYFAFNQTLTVTDTAKTIYLCFTGASPSTTLPTDVITVSWGTSGTDPAPNGDSRNETTGSYIKIN